MLYYSNIIVKYFVGLRGSIILMSRLFILIKKHPDNLRMFFIT